MTGQFFFSGYFVPQSASANGLKGKASLSRPWFKEWRWIYLPVSIEGWLAMILTAAFCVNTFLAVDRHSHSASDTLYGIFPYWVPALGILLWVAGRTSGKAG